MKRGRDVVFVDDGGGDGVRTGEIHSWVWRCTLYIMFEEL